MAIDTGIINRAVIHLLSALPHRNRWIAADLMASFTNSIGFYVADGFTLTTGAAVMATHTIFG